VRLISASSNDNGKKILTTSSCKLFWSGVPVSRSLQFEPNFSND
jgi:hypothetical protein